MIVVARNALRQVIRADSDAERYRKLLTAD